MRLTVYPVSHLLRDLGSQRLRTALTVFGIIWGTVAVSLLLAFGQGFHRQLIRNAAGLGTKLVIAWPALTSVPYEGLGKGRPIRLTEVDTAAVRKRSLLLGEISPEYEQELRLELGRRTLRVPIVGVEPPFGEMRNLIPQAGGRFLNPLDEERRRRVAFLGNEIAETLFGSSDPVGQTLRIHGSEFLVVGLMQEKIQNSNYSGNDDDRIYIPAATFRTLTGQRYLDDFVFTARQVEWTEPLIAEVRALLAARQRFDPADEEALQIWDVTEMARFLDAFMLAFKLFLGIVGSLTLVVGGIGVSNIMNVAVEERTREIGIKMSLGARPRAVLLQILLETVVITAAGGVVGLLLAAGICSLFPAFELTDYVGNPAITPLIALITVGLLGVIGLLAGYFPARTAARLDPVVAMRS